MDAKCSAQCSDPNSSQCLGSVRQVSPSAGAYRSPPRGDLPGDRAVLFVPRAPPKPSVQDSASQMCLGWRRHLLAISKLIRSS